VTDGMSRDSRCPGGRGTSGTTPPQGHQGRRKLHAPALYLTSMHHFYAPQERKRFHALTMRHATISSPVLVTEGLCLCSLSGTMSTT
jgi:hypothetical protein